MMMLLLVLVGRAVGKGQVKCGNPNQVQLVFRIMVLTVTGLIYHQHSKQQHIHPVHIIIMIK
jgi:hypothetical protein